MMILGMVAMIAVGILLGLIGGGGSILTLPILVYLFQLPPALATGYSLFIVGVAAIFGALQYARRGLISYRMGLIFAGPALVGVYGARRFIIPALPENILELGPFLLTKDALIMLVFAIMMILASFSMLRERKTLPANLKQEESKHEAHHTQKHQLNPWMIAGEGILVGALTGFVGAGGGFLIIPALVYFAKLDIKYAIGTSLMIIAIKSILGFAGDITASQDIQWGFLLVLTAISAVGILLGSQLVPYISSARLKKGFGWFVLLMGIMIMGMQVLGG